MLKGMEKGERNSLSGKYELAHVRLISGEPSYLKKVWGNPEGSLLLGREGEPRND